MGDGAMKLEEQIKFLKEKKLVHKRWYLENYPDVAIIKMDHVEHYVKYGALLGRNPSKFFDTKFYLATYPDVQRSGMNPLVHYAKHGQQEGRLKTPLKANQKGGAQRKVAILRRKMQSLGFTKQPLIDLQYEVEHSKNPYMVALAAKELALHFMRQKTEDGYRKCLEMLGKCRIFKGDEKFLGPLFVIEALCLFFLGRKKEGQDMYGRVQAEGLIGPDFLLAYSNFFKNEEKKIRYINQALDLFGIPHISLIENSELPRYDRLDSTDDFSTNALNDGPLITVLVAAYNAENTIQTTLAALRKQSWRNLEILVLDDCSTDNTCKVVEDYCCRDSRIRLLRMSENGGAYVARNVGLRAARGEYVTIHDADDWSHPQKIALQAQFLLDHPDVIGCTSQQARANSDLEFTRWTGGGVFLITNTSSFMFRKRPVLEEQGGWDTVRFAADNELVRRIQAFYGEASVIHLKTGPLSFQRDSDSSVVAHEIFGINGLPSGIRLEYLEAQLYYHRKGVEGGRLNYGNSSGRAFPAPVMMLPDRDKRKDEHKHFDVIIASDFRMQGGSTHSNLEEILAHKKLGIRTGLIQMYRYDFDARPERMMIDDVREQVDGDSVSVLTYGQEVSCDLLIVRYPPVLQHHQMYVPKVHAKNIKVIVNQPPMSDYTENGVVRYKLKDCAENIQTYFGQPAVWHPIGPVVREVLLDRHAEELPYIELSDDDWLNIIDLSDWSRPAPRENLHDPVMRIGRHSRDNFVKWPASKSDLLNIYPERSDVEIHVLGGATAVSDVVGYIPKNWVVHEFGSMAPRDFLADVDVFVYFAHPDWVESFGRTMIEAMAVGVPVVVPDIYKNLFEDAAIYATPDNAYQMARALYDDKERYMRQVEYAKKYVQRKFGYEMHFNRLSKLGVSKTAVSRGDSAHAY